MTRRALVTVLLTIVVALAAPHPAHAASGVRTVVLVLAPRLTWDDVTSGDMPALNDLVTSGAVANMNPNSQLEAWWPDSVTRGALMLSAGASAHDASAVAPVQSATAGSPIVYPGLVTQRAANASNPFPTDLGALGQAIRDSGGVSVALGNSDAGTSAVAVHERPAAIVAMDGEGRVATGDISQRLLRPSPTAALGVLTDVVRLVAESKRMLDSDSIAQGRSLIVVDSGDMERAYLAGGMDPGLLDHHERAEALRSLDRLIAGLRPEMPADGLLVVASPVSQPSAGTPSGFAPVVISGSGWKGMMSSPSTRKSGVVTMPDLTASILAVLAVDEPLHVLGAPIQSDGAEQRGRDRIQSLAEMDTSARLMDAIREPVQRVYVGFFALLLGFGALLPAMRIRRRWALNSAIVGILFGLTVPVAGLLMFVPVRSPQSADTAVALLAIVTLGIVTANVSTHLVFGLDRAYPFVALLTVEVLILDQWFGAPLSATGFFGYSALSGARYYGMGNEMSGLLVGAALCALGLSLDHYGTRRWGRVSRRWGAAGVGVICVLTASAPFLGANIGVAVWGSIAFVVGWTGMNGIRVSWRTVLVGLLVAVVLVAALSFFDTTRGGSATHVGRAISDAGRAGFAEIATIVQRRAVGAWRSTVGSYWSVLLLVLAGVMTWLRFRRIGSTRDLLDEHPAFRSAVAACLVGAVFAFLSEDSGLVLPAWLLLFPAGGLVYMSLARAVREAASE